MTAVRSWMRTDEHSIGLVMLVLGVALVATTLTMMLGS